MNKVKSTLLHELQHAIQFKEGFARGGSPEGVERGSEAFMNDPLVKRYAMLLKIAEKQKLKPTLAMELDRVADKLNANYERYWRLAGEVEERNTQARALMSDTMRKLVAPSETQSVPNSDVVVVYHGDVMASKGLANINPMQEQKVSQQNITQDRTKLEELFKDLSPRTKPTIREAALERINSFDGADKIRYVEENFYDILGALEESGKVVIEC